MKNNKLFTFILSAASIFLIMACNFGMSAPQTPATDSASTEETQPDVSVVPSEAPVNPEVAPAKPASACDNPYLPIVVGAEWVYKTTDETTNIYTRSIEKIEADGFFDKDVYEIGVTREAHWQCADGALIALDPNDSAASVTSQGIDLKLETVAAEGVTLPASMSEGDTWKQTLSLEGNVNMNDMQFFAKESGARECAYIGKESVTVEAGTFDAHRIDCKLTLVITITSEGMDIPTNTSFMQSEWYAEGVGLVKTLTDLSGAKVASELISYKIP